MCTVATYTTPTLLPVELFRRARTIAAVAAEVLMRCWYHINVAADGQPAPLQCTSKPLAKCAVSALGDAVDTVPRGAGQRGSRNGAAGADGQSGASFVRHVVIPGFLASQPEAVFGPGQHMPSAARCSAKAHVALLVQRWQQSSSVVLCHSKYMAGELKPPARQSLAHDSFTPLAVDATRATTSSAMSKKLTNESYVCAACT